MAKERQKNDYYATPQEIANWSVDRCMELRQQLKCEADPAKLSMMEPGCGPIAPFATRAASIGIKNILGIELDEIAPTDVLDMEKKVGMEVFSGFDFLSEKDHAGVEREFDIIATNPPFKEGADFVSKALDFLAPNGVMAILQKMSFQASAGRFEFWKKFPPLYTHILATKRPSFAHGKTDNQEYCVFFWAGSEISAKHRRKYGPRTITKWEDNKSWIKRFNDGWDR